MEVQYSIQFLQVFIVNLLKQHKFIVWIQLVEVGEHEKQTKEHPLTL